jgi:hypothetical protein
MSQIFWAPYFITPISSFLTPAPDKRSGRFLLPNEIAIQKKFPRLIFCIVALQQRHHYKQCVRSIMRKK